MDVKEPKNFKERETVATSCAANLKISIPIVIDNMDNAVEGAYAAWPDRLYVIDRDGKIAYKSGPGPRGFIPAEAEAVLKRLLGK